MLLSILKTLGLCLSFAGWMYWFKRWLRVDFCFVPAAVFSAAGVAVYFGGILFRLEQAAWLVYAGWLPLRPLPPSALRAAQGPPCISACGRSVLA